MIYYSPAHAMDTIEEDQRTTQYVAGDQYNRMEAGLGHVYTHMMPFAIEPCGLKIQNLYSTALIENECPIVRATTAV